MSRDALKAHLEFFGELGVDGVRREPEWRRRGPAARGASLSGPPGEPDQPSRSALRRSAVASAEAEAFAPQPAPQIEPAPVFRTPADALAAVRQDLGDCTRCKLHRLGRKQIVFGVGNPNADLMFVGEGPGADEDIQGEPFVGRAGQLLTKIIEAIGLRREDVYIANVIKCRPPSNRNPEPDEVEQCEPFLFRQIQTVRPRVIVALGKFAAQSLLRTTDPITKLRGREYKYRDAILMPTYHPAYLLRTPSAKREVWEDMKKVRAILQGN
jgi:uracil-DNA glycosylase